MKYTELKSKHEAEINDFPIAFAFTQRQLEEGLSILGITKAEALGTGAGGFIRKTDKVAFLDLFKRHETEREQALQDDEFLLDAIEYELGNHEYCITGDPEPALAVVGVSLENERVSQLFHIARKNYLTNYYEWEAQQERAGLRN